MKEAFEAEGEVVSLDLLGALCAVGREGTTGRAIFVRGLERIVFVFERGVLVDLEAPGESSVSEVLIRSGKIQRETYDALIIPTGEDRFAVATASGVISRKEASWGRKLSAIESLAGLLSWPEGTYTFDPLAPDTSSGFRLPVDKWILELFLRSNDRALVMSRLGPTDLPLVKAESFAPAFSALGLTADADAIASLVDGERSVEQIVRKAHADDFAVLKLLAALITLGLVRPSYEAPFPLAGAAEESSARPLEPPDPSTKSEAQAFESSPAASSEPVVSPAPIALPLFALTAPEPQEPEPPFQAEPEQPLPPRHSHAGMWVGFLVVLAAAALWWELGRRREAPPPPPVEKTTERATSAPRTSERPARTAPNVEVDRRSSIVVVPADSSISGSAARATGAVPERSAEPRAGKGTVTWKIAAEKGRRTFEHPGEFAYTIQLELACEESTVAKALAADPSGHRVWIAPYEFRGRRCYRVLWGKYKNLSNAKEAKASIPPVFLQNGNWPAVVALPGAKRSAKTR